MLRLRTRVGFASLPQKKGSNYRWKKFDILARQSRTPEFLAKNSSGAVPVLELDDGSCLSESVAICRYLEGLQPEPNLLGRDLSELALRLTFTRRARRLSVDASQQKDASSVASHYNRIDSRRLH